MAVVQTLAGTVAQMAGTVAQLAGTVAIQAGSPTPAAPPTPATPLADVSEGHVYEIYVILVFASVDEIIILLKNSLQQYFLVISYILVFAIVP